MNKIGIQNKTIIKDAFILLVFGQTLTHALVTLSAH